jgi:predicted Zn-dependent protease
MQLAEWFDGQRAASREVEVRLSDGFVELIDGNGEPPKAALAELVRLPSERGELRLGHKSIDGWRLVFMPPIDPVAERALPKRGAIDPVLRRKPVMLAVAAMTVATLAMIALIAAPDALARHMPMSWERKLGSLYDLPVGAFECEDPKAQVILDRLVDRLDPAARKDGFQIQLLDVDEANAAALPGQRMIVFRGLLDEVEDPDALAGIIAHEIAHVRNRHVAAGMVRDLGIGTVVTLAGGGALAAGGGDLMSLRFTREAESEADRDAIAMLQRAAIDPAKTGLAFDRFSKDDADFPEWASSHPASAGRAAKFRAGHNPAAKYRPGLDQSETKRLADACSD